MSTNGEMMFSSSDITTDPEQATSGSSALSKYMQKMQHNSDQFMEKLYTNTIDRPCLPACEHDDAIEFFMNCRREPLSFLHFHKKAGSDGENHLEDFEMPLPGAYTIPTTCEYCKAEHVSNCAPDCQRPKLFFRKKRPPFVPVGDERNGRTWDPVTGFELEKEAERDPPEMVDEEAVEEAKKKLNSVKGRKTISWMGGLFRGSPTAATVAS